MIDSQPMRSISAEDDQPKAAGRRTTLKGLGLAGIVGMAGCNVAATDNATRGRGAASSATAQPTETGWQVKQPPLKTPWTDQVSPTNALPDYPRPQMVRQDWINLNGVWQFAAAGEGAPPPFGRDLAERILVPFPVESALSGIMRHEARMFYRRRFVVPGNWRVGSDKARGQRLLLHFDAVDWEARVWVNGSAVGTHRGGYDRFSIDITDALHHDQGGAPSGEQELVVGVDDPTEDGAQPVGKQRNSAIANPKRALYYTPSSGIWQTVWLEPVPAAHIERLDLRPDPADDSLNIIVHTAPSAGHAVSVTASDGARAVAHATGMAGLEIKLRMPGAKRWSPDDPFLYDLDVRLLDTTAGGKTGAPIDQVSGYFGMRSIAVKPIDGQPRIMLNGESFFPLSTLQQGFWPDGIYTPATDEALLFDLEQNKRLGFNTARKHQKVEPDRWYYHADRLGQLVWQDMPCTAAGRQPPDPKQPAPRPSDAGNQQFESELRRMVDQLRNYPSVVIWTPFNEGWGEYDTARIAALVKSWDPSRLVDEMSGFNVCDCAMDHGDFFDRHNLGKAWPGPAPRPDDHKRVAVIGEFGAFGLSVPGHSWDAENDRPNVKVADAAALNRNFVAAMGEIEKFITQSGLGAANYNLFEDAEHQVNGLFTYDRAHLKADPDQVRRANLHVIAAGRNAGAAKVAT